MIIIQRLGMKEQLYVDENSKPNDRESQTRKQLNSKLMLKSFVREFIDSRCNHGI